MPKRKVLIAVKTYPVLSAKYQELVCTAGFTEQDEWIRIYPVPYRQLDYEKQYKKFQWITVALEKNTRCPSPLSSPRKSLDLLSMMPRELGTQ